MKDGFIKVAAAAPSLHLADCSYNAARIAEAAEKAVAEGVKLLVTPELSLTGYTCGDLFFQKRLQDSAVDALSSLLARTASLPLMIAVGLPLCHLGKLYNCAALLYQGEILGVVPKTNLPNYGEAYEKRIFAPAPAESDMISLLGESVPFGKDLLFRCNEVRELVLGFELCEDLCVPCSPSVDLAMAGATIIGNLAASNDVVGKSDYRRQMVTAQSTKLTCGYLYASSGEGESSSDLVYGAHQLIAENGKLLAERRFEGGLLISEIDVQRIAYERRRMQSAEELTSDWEVPFSLTVTETKLTRYVAANPFVPEEKESRDACCREALLLASLGLKQRIEHTNSKCAVVGLSGGLDSTLAVLITGLAM